MKSLYDFDIYYNGEVLSDVVYIDDMFAELELGCGYYIEVTCIKNEKLVKIIDLADNFKFVERPPMIERLG